MKMLKLPPKEKIPEAYTALEDNRIKLLKNQAIVESRKKEKEFQGKCFVGYANEIEKNTSSGGIFPLLANSVLKENGIVVGAMLDEQMKLKHVAIEKREELEPLKGSKYLQSNLGSIFSYIKKEVPYKKILFVGTPCQVSGLKSFLNKEYENLICVDLICHGVVTPFLFKKYIQELEVSKKDKIVSFSFRDKSTGWDTYFVSAQFTKKKYTELQKKNKYMKLFLANLALRESCYNCQFKINSKSADITLGDFWQVKEFYPEMYQKEGVSAIVVHTKKGKDLFLKIKDQMNTKKCKLEEILYGNMCLSKSVTIPLQREEFLNDMKKMNTKKLAKKYVKTSIVKKVINKLKG